MPWRRIVDFFVNNSILLVRGAAGGLLRANVGFGSYHWFTHGLHFVVNDVGCEPPTAYRLVERVTMDCGHTDPFDPPCGGRHAVATLRFAGSPTRPRRSS
jgi:hypothetical protein